MVTVQFSANSSIATGLPTMLERPITTASLPDSGTPDCLSMYMIPLGVQATTPSWPVNSLPALSIWNPSTSFWGKMLASTASSSRCLGSGNCTKMPWICGSWFNASIASISSSWAMSLSSLTVRE